MGHGREEAQEGSKCRNERGEGASAGRSLDWVGYKVGILYSSGREGGRRCRSREGRRRKRGKKSEFLCYKI